MAKIPNVQDVMNDALKAANINRNMPLSEQMKLMREVISKNERLGKLSVGQLKSLLAKTGRIDQKYLKVISKAILNPEQTRVHNTVRQLGTQTLLSAAGLGAQAIQADVEKHRISSASATNRLADNYSPTVGTRDEEDDPGLEDGGWN